VREWAGVYLQAALERLGPQLHGYDLSIEDVYTFQQLCAYEVRRVHDITYSSALITSHQTVGLGYSKFCELFTEAEWEGFNYS
jgi:hypothetical protein